MKSTRTSSMISILAALVVVTCAAGRTSFAMDALVAAPRPGISQSAGGIQYIPQGTQFLRIVFSVPDYNFVAEPKCLVTHCTNPYDVNTCFCQVMGTTEPDPARIAPLTALVPLYDYSATFYEKTLTPNIGTSSQDDTTEVDVSSYTKDGPIEIYPQLSYYGGFAVLDVTPLNACHSPIIANTSGPAAMDAAPACAHFDFALTAATNGDAKQSRLLTHLYRSGDTYFSSFQIPTPDGARPRMKIDGVVANPSATNKIWFKLIDPPDVSLYVPLNARVPNDNKDTASPPHLMASDQSNTLA